MADALEKILDGVEPKKALGIAKYRGGQEVDFDEKFNRDVMICDAILRLGKSGKTKGIEPIKAKVAESLGFDLPTVEEAWRNKPAKNCAKAYPGMIR